MEAARGVKVAQNACSPTQQLQSLCELCAEMETFVVKKIKPHLPIFCRTGDQVIFVYI
jgi:hypothetical protein